MEERVKEYFMSGFHCFSKNPLSVPSTAYVAFATGVDPNKSLQRCTLTRIYSVGCSINRFRALVNTVDPDQIKQMDMGIFICNHYHCNK
jgi:hypothetical protein